MYGTIYLILHRASGKKYVGQTTRKLKERIRYHIKNHGIHGTMVGNALRKHGVKAFDFAIIDGADSMEELNAKEQRWIEHYGSMKPFGYNYTAGGDGSPGLKHSEATKEKIRQITTGKKASDETRQKMSLQRKGKTWSEDYKRKMSDVKKGIAFPHMKRLRTPEWKQKLSEARARWWARHPERRKSP